MVAAVGLLATAPSPLAQTPTPITIVIKRSIKFEDFASDLDIPGTVVVDPDGNKTVTGGVVDFGGNHRAGRFQILGEPKAFVIVTMPSSVTMTKNSNPTFTMTMDNFTIEFTNPIKLNNSGKKTVDWGATLNVGADQKKGNYSGSIPINVEYQ